MQVGDLVWSINHKQTTTKVVVERRLAIIIEIKENYINPYTIQLVACGRSGITSRKYLEPLDRD